MPSTDPFAPAQPPVGPPRFILIMGVTGSGKSTVGAALAQRLALPFLDADDLHPPTNVEKLRAGVPLTDDDRRPWLLAVREAWLAGAGGVLACSALKATYRDELLHDIPSPAVVFLRAPIAVIRARLEMRHGHFASPAILDSQFATLEEPKHAIVVEASGDAESVINDLLGSLKADA